MSQLLAMNILSPICEAESGENNEETVISVESPQQDYNEIVIDDNKSEKKQRLIDIHESQQLARCNVLYLGSAIPTPNKIGIDSIQEPLSKRYPTDGTEFVQGVEAWLSIDENGLQIQFVVDPSHVLYYPIQSLTYCASVRFLAKKQTGEKPSDEWAFIPLDYPEASQIDNAHNPPLFVASFQRTRSLPAEECHCFVIKSAQIGVALVQACVAAYESTNLEQDCSKVPLYLEIKDDGSNMQETDNVIHIVPAFDDEATFDYQTNKNYSGFFYKTNQMSIEFWQLWESPKHNHNRSSSRLSIKSLSSNSSRRNSHQRRRTSIKSNPDITQSLSPTVSIENSVQEAVISKSDQSTNDTNIICVESNKHIDADLDVSMKWPQNTSESTEKISSNIESNYDFYIDFDVNHPTNQSDREISNEMKKLVLNDDDIKNLFMIYNKYQSTITDNEEKTPKKKHKIHKHKNHEVTNDFHQESHTMKTPKRKHQHKNHEITNEFHSELHTKKTSKRKHRHKNHDINEISEPVLITQNSSASPFSMTFPYNAPVSFYTLPLSSQSNFIYSNTSYWSI